MDPTIEAWRMFFESWPSGMRREGLILTKLNDNIPFVDYRFSDTMVLVDRGKPDSYNTRRVAIPYTEIAAVKFLGLEDLESFKDFGFRPPIG